MYTPPFWVNLPSEITINILLRLPIKTILSCKCVCKPWLELLSTPEFAKSHLSTSIPGLAVQQADKMCKIFEFEDGLDLQRHDLRYNPVMQFSTRGTFSPPNANTWIRGSVNGLLLFHDFDEELPDSLYICNPITHEYISLPKPQGIVKFPDSSEYGFGVSAITGQYKVVRNLRKCPVRVSTNARPCSRIQDYECLVYTVGTGSWRRVPSGGPFGHFPRYFSVFLNGNLHGLVLDYCGSGNMLISCFDLETELFKPFPPPPPSMDFCSFGSLGVLDDCLCFVGPDEEDSVVIWVMKEYGVEKSWTKLFVVVDALDFIGEAFQIVHGMKAFKDGDVLLYGECINLFYYSSTNKICHRLDLFAGNPCSDLDVILYKPSLFSLKSFRAENVKSF